MLVSGFFDSKISGFSNLADYYESFVTICDRIQQLQQKRIVERLARPIANELKLKLMDETNRTLQGVQDIMDEIRQLSCIFKGKETALIHQHQITAHAWKNGVRKVQSRITDFYETKMKYFNMVNDNMELGLTLCLLGQKQWAKACLSKMNPFCLCG